MSVEYVKLAPLETVFGETNLLHSQLSLLTILKRYREYEAFRKEELFLKIELKKKLGETKEFLDALGKSLPESKLIEEQEKKDRMQREFVEKVESAVQKSNKKEWTHWKEDAESKKEEKSSDEKLSPLDKELEEIRKKLERLQ